MSDSSLAIAQTLAAGRAASARQALQTEVVRQQALQDQALVALLQQSVDTQKASLPAGQGAAVDISA